MALGVRAPPLSLTHSTPGDHTLVRPPGHRLRLVISQLCCLLQGLQVGQGLRVGLPVIPGECHGAGVRVLR